MLQDAAIKVRYRTPIASVSCAAHSDIRSSAENGPWKASISGTLIRYSAVAALTSGIGGTFLNRALPSAI